MSIFTAGCRYREIKRLVARARRRRLGFDTLSDVAGLALALEDGDQEEVERLAKRLDLDPDALR